MTGDASKHIASGDMLQTNRIESLTSPTNGFTVGTNADVNGNGTTYYWIAFKDDGAGDFKVGSYTGNGVDNRSITGVGFQADYLIVVPSSGQRGVQRFAGQTGDNSLEFAGTASTANLIQALQSDGFQVGNDNRVNANGTVYHYVAWKAGAGKVKVGSYSGNATDNRSFTGIGFQPEYVIIKGDSNAIGVHRSAQVAGDTTLRFTSTSSIANSIQLLQPDGFQLGTDSTVNGSGTTYYYVAFNINSTTKLAITSVNGGANPVAGTAFSVIVQSQDSGGAASPVSATTGISLSLETGTGKLGGTLTGTITAGTSQTTINGVTYTKAESTQRGRMTTRAFIITVPDSTIRFCSVS
jgi:hypothetical protein